MGNSYFDQHYASYFVLVDDGEQHSMWPAFAEVPPGWRVCYGKAHRSACLSYIDTHWPNSRRTRRGRARL